MNVYKRVAAFLAMYSMQSLHFSELAKVGEVYMYSCW